ncbi:probable apyrase 2 [Lolium rigidum]|uniref:probable apyrase 2 n=1 Tax=Lolium rigidum TaxID=89674 RepID=UPI001F5D7715|nr:probable apyrase 2 [Lolium rigidum]
MFFLKRQPIIFIFIARAEILQAGVNGYNNCIFDQEFRADVVKALKENGACTHMKCSFGRTSNGGDGDGKENLFASFFFDRAAERSLWSHHLPTTV